MKKKERSSNIELLRIIMILMVIAHHLVVNSGVSSLFKINHVSRKLIVIQIFGWGGKIAIDGFLIITGYFMCKSTATMYKWFRIFLEYTIYSVFFTTCFLIVGYEPVGRVSLVQGYLPFYKNLMTGVDSYPALFLVLFLFIPFLNKLIHSMDKREYEILIGLLIFFYSILSTFFFRRGTVDGQWHVSDNWEGLTWYCTVYLIGGYIRLHLSKNVDCLKVGAIATTISILLSWISIVAIDYLGLYVSYYHMVAGANKFLAITIAVSIFNYSRICQFQISRRLILLHRQHLAYC